MGLGPVMLDVLGTQLTAEDEARLIHPLVGGVILFARNYQSPGQLTELTAAIHALRTPPLLIAVDHEGGRVQRFREGFTKIPAMRELGRIWDAHPQRARHLAQQAGYVLAAELRACGVDFSFTPVLDVDYGQSSVIGDRAFHSDPQAIAELAHSLLLGLKQGGMHSVGKHFPGHGYVKADSHLDIPVDEREFVDIEMSDLIPFRRMVDCGLAAVMPAHVIYPKVDSRPAGFSPVWLKKHPARSTGLRWCDFQRRPEHGRCQRRGRHRAARGGRAECGLRHGAGVQQAGIGGRTVARPGLGNARRKSRPARTDARQIPSGIAGSAA